LSGGLRYQAANVDLPALQIASQVIKTASSHEVAQKREGYDMARLSSGLETLEAM